MPQVRIGQGEDRFMRVTRGISIVQALLVCTGIFALLAGPAGAQQPAPAPPPSDSQSTQPSQQPGSSSSAPSSAPASSSSSSSSNASSSSSSGKRSKHANDFLVIGTVFTDKAYALPGAHIRVRRSSEKKFRWETYTNSRGEFAFRVPQGDEYEIVIIAKGFADQNQMVSTKSGISEDTVVYRMQPALGGKK
jgi:Carboxypeptidase regulatory-like domain